MTLLKKQLSLKWNLQPLEENFGNILQKMKMLNKFKYPNFLKNKKRYRKRINLSMFYVE